MTQSTTRLSGVDFARGMAVLFMILIHSQETFAAPTAAASIVGRIIAYLGEPPGAPVFMTAMGLSYYFSRNTGVRHGIRRGLQLIALGYLLNLLRGVLPMVAIPWLAPDRVALIPPAVADLGDAMRTLDILHFAGIAYIAMTLLRASGVNRYWMLVLAAVTALAAPAVCGTGASIPVLGPMLDYLWGDIPSQEPVIANLVRFPFFPWFTYVLVGMFLGETLT